MKLRESISVEGGVAENMGDGVWIVIQVDEAGLTHSVALNDQDLKRMLGIE